MKSRIPSVNRFVILYLLVCAAGIAVFLDRASLAATTRRSLTPSELAAATGGQNCPCCSQYTGATCTYTAPVTNAICTAEPGGLCTPATYGKYCGAVQMNDHGKNDQCLNLNYPPSGCYTSQGYCVEYEYKWCDDHDQNGNYFACTCVQTDEVVDEGNRDVCATQNNGPPIVIPCQNYH
jgi:hypothetical protein